MNVTRYKIGDKIRIKSIDWYERNKDNNGDVEVRHCGRFLEGMSNYCGQEHKIESIPGPGIYVLDVSFAQQKRYFFYRRYV